LDNFAKSKQFDPLDAKKWYSIRVKEILRAGGAGLLNNFKGSHINALRKAYPELMLNKKLFLQSQEGWKTTARQRRFFDDFAKSKQFDPLDAEKWSSISRKEIVRAGGRGILNYYKSHISALIKLYPEIRWKEKPFLRFVDVTT